MTLIWSDEFNSYDADTWTSEVGGGGWGNDELAYFTDAQNTSIEFDESLNSNVLVIEAREETPADSECWYGVCRYTSARMLSRDSQNFTYGRFEAKIKMPQTQGIWPSFWMLGSDYQTTGWPETGEIDIMEHVGFEPSIVHATLHGPGYSGSSPLTKSYDLGESVDLNYHVFAVEWREDNIRWFVNDVETYSVTREDVEVYGNWVYNHDFFIILGIGVGGGWPGSPDDTSVFPQRMYVDYVRVYELDDAVDPGVDTGEERLTELPGVLEMESYAKYSDSTAGNEGGEYREDDVDLQATTNAGGGFNVGWVTPGEWLDYQISVDDTGSFDINVETASEAGGGEIRLLLDGEVLVSGIQLPGTETWQTWTSVKVRGLDIAQGEHTLRVEILSGEFNLDFIEFVPAGPNPLVVDKQKGEWTLVTVPDTQNYSENQGKAPIAYMHRAFDWIVEAKDDLNIQFVQGLGDITQNWDNRAEWDTTSEAWYKLSGQVPFMPIEGNHDSTLTLNEYFPVSAFSSEPWWGGDSGGIENNYGLMTIGQEDYMFLHIQNYDQYTDFRQNGIDWANQVLTQHADRKVILATHDIWATDHIRNNLLQGHDNIVLTNAGHHCVRETYFVERGPNGGVSNNFVTDYQCDQQEIMLLRYYVFKPLEDRVDYYTYSPITGEFESDENSEGSFPLVQADP